MAKKKEKVDDKVCPKCGLLCIQPVLMFDNGDFIAVHKTERIEVGSWSYMKFVSGCDKGGRIQNGTT